MSKKTFFTGLTAAALVAGAAGLWQGDLQAADHAEAPATGADPVADIADYYA